MTTQICLMTLNLRVSAADDGPNRWQARWPHVKTLIKAVRPDVLGVQECMPNQLAALMGELYGFFAYPGPETMLTGHHAIRNPIFVCEGCLPQPFGEGAFALNASGVIGQHGWDAAESRLAHWLRFEGWALINTHFDHVGARARLESARLITEFLRAEPAAIVCGDLNCTPETPPLEHFRAAGYALAKDALPPDVDRRTLTKFTGQQLAELDYVLLRGARAIRTRIPRPRHEPPYLSDHDPVVVEVQLP
ncbi:MAG: endonuclease/exonuclease/phosphatase family protein [Anaerolineae bacterium]|nr:endonuclease/exonuclease/phosphatase family protein [Anaerolineae bacterium]